MLPGIQRRPALIVLKRR